MRKQFHFFTVITSLLFILCFSPTQIISKGAREDQSVSLHENKRLVIVYPQGEDTLLLDPYVASDELSLLILEGLYEGLYRVEHETGNAIPAIAKKVVVSNDGLKWTFHLDSSATFSNEDAITAKVFVDSWLHLLESSSPQAQKSYLVSLFDVIKGAKEYRLGNGNKKDVGIYETSKYTLEILLNNKAPYLPSLLTNVTFAAIHPDSYKQKKHTFISSGAYTLKEMHDDNIILEKNPKYREASFVKNDYVEILIRNDQQAIEAYLNKEAHWLFSYVPPQFLRTRKDLHLSKIYATGFFYFSASTGPYSDSRVRKAISLITPWDDIRNNSGQLFVTNTLIPTSESITGKRDYIISYAQDEAKRLLNMAGYNSFSELPPLHMAIHRGAPIQETAMNLAQSWSNSLKIPVIVDTVPLSLYTRYPRENPYDVSYITWVADFKDPFAFLPLFSSSSSYNIANYSNATYDDLLEKAVKSSNEEERKNAIEEAQKMLLEEAIIFPIHSGFSLHIIDSTRVKGWYDNSINIHPLRSLEVIEQ